jgi:hypothetical protein
MVNCRLKDIDEGAYLWCAGMTYKSHELEDIGHRKVVWFIFEGDNGVDAAALRNTYRNGEAKVEPKSFASKQFELRKIVREITGRQRSEG